MQDGGLRGRGRVHAHLHGRGQFGGAGSRPVKEKQVSNARYRHRTGSTRQEAGGVETRADAQNPHQGVTRTGESMYAVKHGGATLVGVPEEHRRD